MRDRLDLDPFEQRFADDLARHAAMARDPRPTAEIAAAAMRPHRVFRRVRSDRRRATLLVLAAAMLVPLAALVAVSSPTRPTADQGTYQAVMLRPVADTADVDVILVRTDGQQRPLRRLRSTDIMPAGSLLAPYGKTSPEGWLAMRNNEDGPGNSLLALIDLGDPGRVPRLAPYQMSGGWGPGGRYAAGCPGPSSNDPSAWPTPIPADAPCPSNGGVQVIDARTGSRLALSGVGLAGSGGPDLIWAADGSGLLVSHEWNHTLCPGEPCFQSAPLSIFPVNGGPIVPGVPELYPRLDARRFAQGARVIDRWAQSTEGVVVGEGWVLDEEGLSDFATRTTWYSDELAPATTKDSSFSADGRSLWVLLDGEGGSRTILAHVSTPGSAEVVATAPIGTGYEFGAIAGMAPDDSIVAIDHHYPDAQSTLTLIPTGGQTASTHGGSLAGFVPTSLADSWPGEGSFAPVPDDPHPDMTPRPSGSITSGLPIT